MRQKKVFLEKTTVPAHLTPLPRAPFSSMHKITISHKSREDRVSKTWTNLRCPKFSQSVSPCGVASGGGSRGSIPLHLAAEQGADSVVQQLLEANAAVDAKNNMGRGLGRGLRFNGKPHEALDRCQEVDPMLIVQVFWWILFSVFVEGISQNIWH